MSTKCTNKPEEDLVDFTVLSLLVSICREPMSATGRDGDKMCSNSWQTRRGEVTCEA